VNFILPAPVIPGMNLWYDEKNDFFIFEYIHQLSDTIPALNKIGSLICSLTLLFRFFHGFLEAFYAFPIDMQVYFPYVDYTDTLTFYTYNTYRQ
jgi:hypothetical protein